jgi:hypothetical protein
MPQLLLMMPSVPILLGNVDPQEIGMVIEMVVSSNIMIGGGMETAAELDTKIEMIEEWIALEIAEEMV